MAPLKSIIFIIMEKNDDLHNGKKTNFKFPTEGYLNILKKGYKDWSLDEKYLKQGLKN